RVDDATTRGVHLLIPPWGVEGHLHKNDSQNSLHSSLNTVLKRLKLLERDMIIKVYPSIPRAMGLGGSAALAVAVVRALSAHFHLGLSDDEVNALAFESEQVAHGTASGIDNTLATFGRFTLFKKDDPKASRVLKVPRPIPIVIGMSGVEGLTAKTVAQVQGAWRKNTALYENIFNDIDALTMQAVEAIEAYDLDLLGELMNINQGLLNALRVSSWELEELIEVARKHGAVGAKLTGGGGGGSMVALCPEEPERVAEAMRKAGYKAITTTIGSAQP
ncbi:MAG TPA: mevalonate kinase, partial [Myxococcota bacterium]|nr:mevalonate kinase [Myxococcota bacterium]